MALIKHDKCTITASPGGKKLWPKMKHVDIKDILFILTLENSNIVVYKKQ